MDNKIAWDSLSVTDIAEIKSLLQSLAQTLMGINSFILNEGLKPSLITNEQILSYQFSILSSDFTNTIRLGKELEKVYYQLLKDFQAQLRNHVFNPKSGPRL